MAKGELEVKCDKFEDCKFRQGGTLHVCADYVMRTGGVKEHCNGAHVYCAFYKQVNVKGVE